MATPMPTPTTPTPAAGPPTPPADLTSNSRSRYSLIVAIGEIVAVAVMFGLALTRLRMAEKWRRVLRGRLG